MFSSAQFSQMESCIHKTYLRSYLFSIKMFLHLESFHQDLTRITFIFVWQATY